MVRKIAIMALFLALSFNVSKARDLAIEQVQQLQFGTMVIPLRGVETLTISAQGNVDGTGIYLDKPTNGSYALYSDKETVVNIDIQNAVSGSEHAELKNFTGKFVTDEYEQELVFPTVITLPAGKSYLSLGATLEYHAELKNSRNGVDPNFDIVIEE